MAWCKGVSMEDKKFITTKGKRKKAVARAVIKEGKGIVKINNIPLELFQPEFYRMKIMEPLMIGEGVAAKIDIEVTTGGGGIAAQAEAARQAIARGLVEASKSKHLKEEMEKYDRNLLVYDPRRTEPHKESRSCKGPRRKRQSSKR